MRKSAAALTLALLVLMAAGEGSRAQTPPEAPDVEIVTERLVLTRGPEGPLVLHMVQLVNVGPRTAERVPLSFPHGAVLLDVPENLMAQDDVLVDPLPMPAGEGRQYVFTYELPWQRLPMPLRRAVLYPTARLEAWAEDSLVLRGVGLRAAGEEEIAGRRFTVYATADLPPHPQWQVLLETTSGPGASVTERERLGQRSDPLDIVRAHPLPGLLLLAAAAVAVGMVSVRRRHVRAARLPSAAGAAGRAATSGSGTAAEIARLKERIVQLDVAFHNGDMGEDVYFERRGALRKELLQLLGAGGASGPGGERSGEQAGEGSS